MIKKVMIAGFFIGGGLFFIKKLLPKGLFSSQEVDIKDYEEQLAENERRRLKDLERDIKSGFKLEDGTFNKNWWLNTNIKFDKDKFLEMYPKLGANG